MKNANLNDLSVFIEVAKANGFRAAAEKLNLGPGSVSEIIKRIEDRLGVRLIERTTRKISLTSAGAALFEGALPALTELENLLGTLKEEQSNVSGTLRLSAPRSSSPLFLDNIIAAFCNAYPQVDVDVLYDDTKVDLITSGVDAVIRSQRLLEKETYAVKIGPTLGMALVASPAYVDNNGLPEKPTDLIHHDGIRFAFGATGRLAPWSFIERKKDPYVVTPKPRLIVNDLTSLINFARAGLGIAYVYKKPIDPFVETGELVALFDKYIPSLPRYTINYLSKRNMPARLRAFIDLAKKHGVKE